MAFKLPWSNFHELNLDWLLEKMKELEEKVNNIVGGATPATNTPNMDGVGSPGSSITYSRGDHTHPTDTSRASQTDMDAMALNVEEIDRELWAGIGAVDDKIKFSTAAPLVDGVANPGSSDAQARADHVHPTDTSRASQTQVDSLQAQMDNFSGSANPSDSAPLMDGIGSAGTGGNYARGDHQHPSDTSKLNITGGTITGSLTVDRAFNNTQIQANAASDAIGWKRVADVPNVPGSSVEIEISKRGYNNNTPAEIHAIRLDIYTEAYAFSNEHSKGTVKIIDKIRYTNAGKLDIHFDQNYSSEYEVYLKPYAPTKSEKDAIKVLNTPADVADAPAGETILAEYSFIQDEYVTTVVSSTHTIQYQSCVTFPIGNMRFTQIDVVGVTTSALSGGGAIVEGLPPMRFQSWALPIYAATNQGALVPMQLTNSGGAGKIQASGNIASGTTFRIQWLYISK